MVNEMWWIHLDELNTWWQVRENTNKVTEEAVRRIQDNQKKAQQIGQDIKKDKATNDKFANFLAFLLSDIKNDTLIKQIYHTFFVTVPETTETNNLNKSMHITVIVGTFVPFYQNTIQELWLEAIYQDIRTFTSTTDLSTYIPYIRELLTKHDHPKTINKEAYTKLLHQIAEHYNLIEKLTPEQSIELEHTIKKELF